MPLKKEPTSFMLNKHQLKQYWLFYKFKMHHYFSDTWVTQKFCKSSVTRSTISQSRMLLLRLWKFTNHNQLWDAKIAWYSECTTTAWNMGPRIHGFSLTWLSAFLQTKQNFLNPLVTVIWSTVPSPFTQKLFWFLPRRLWSSLNS